MYLKSLKYDLPEGELLDIGYFVKMGSRGPLLFTNNKYCLKISLDDVVQVEGYDAADEYDNYETAISIEGGRFLVLGAEKRGVCIFSYDTVSNKLTKVLHLGA